MEYDLISIGKRVTEIRENLGLTKEKFGNSLGVTGDAIYNIENARNKAVNIPVIIAIAAKYSYEEDWILYGIEPKYSKDANILEKVKNTYQLSNLEFALLEEYLKLDKAQRAAFENFLDRVIANKNDYSYLNDTFEEALELVEKPENSGENENSKIG